MEVRLQETEQARQRLSCKLQEASAKGLSFSTRQQRAAELKVNLGDARDTIAELKVCNAGLEEKVGRLPNLNIPCQSSRIANLRALTRNIQLRVKPRAR